MITINPPKNVEVHGSQIRISFTYQGKRFKEPYPKLKLTDSNLIWAGNEANRIKHAIKAGTFDYAKEFPNSAKAVENLCGFEVNLKKTIKQEVDSYLDLYQLTKHKSGYKSAKSRVKHILNYFGENRQIRTIKKIEIEKFKAELINENGRFKLGLKTANEILGVLCQLFASARDELIIDVNLAERVKKYKLPQSNGRNADPFTQKEINTLENTPYHREQDQNMFLFNIWTGLSVAELRALAWEDIDIVNCKLTISRAEVEGQYKCPKELSRVRTIEILSPAMYWLNKQIKLTFNHEPIELSVVQHDSISKIKEKVRLVFKNDQKAQNNKPEILFTQKPMERCFKNWLKHAGVRERAPNQCRHTFASQALSNYVPLEWVAKQLGHSDTTMVKKHYGSWIPQDIRSMREVVEEMMGIGKRYID